MKALVVEDEVTLRRALCDALAGWGFAASCAGTGLTGLERWHAEAPGLVLLDLGLPDIDGLDVLQQARAQGLRTPVLLLTARATLGDRILGLNFGADDYLVKPFDYEELRARLAALVRRGGAAQGELASPPRRLGGLSWTPGATAFYCGHARMTLSPREAALLRALVERPNRACSKQELALAVFSNADVLDDALEVVAHRLRKKLVDCGVAVVTLRGLGYLIKPLG